MISTQIRHKTLNFLSQLIAIPSTRGHEGMAAKLTHEAFLSKLDSVEIVPINDSIIQDPDYNFPLPDFSHKGTPCVECILRGNTPGKAIIFNAHLDVVPPSEGQVDPFHARTDEGIVYGRGACDDKGPLASLYAMVQLFKERHVRPANDLILHFVPEEENGGNGTLAMVRRGVRADAAIVLEPTEMDIVPAVRGAVWFTLEVYGRAAHSGNVATRVSAIEKAFQAIEIFKSYHDRLLSRSRGIPLFDIYPDPMPLTIGQFISGVWPASVPNKAVVKGLIGFLPNVNRQQVKQELRNALLVESDEWLRNNFKLDFNMLSNDGNMISVDHRVVSTLSNSIQNNGGHPKIRALTAACDAWRYSALGIPTVVFGPGSLLHAHAKDEHIRIDDIFTAAEILFDFAVCF